MEARIVRLLVYPIKACQPIELKRCDIGATGVRFDRSFCVIDTSGIRFPKNEALSQRRVPFLASISVAFVEKEGRIVQLRITSKDMKERGPLLVPMIESSMSTKVEVSCSGMSTTSDGGWSLGTLASTSCGKKASDWFTEFIRKKYPKNKKTQEATFALVRSRDTSVRNVSTWAGPTQLPYSDSLKEQREGKASPFQMRKVPVLCGDKVRFHDMAPFLLTSENSLACLSKHMREASKRVHFRQGETEWPMVSFRPNIVVRMATKSAAADDDDEKTADDDDELAFREESWAIFRIRKRDDPSEGVLFRQMKLCPRCTVPARNPTTGEFLLKNNKLLYMKTLKKMFPKKTVDREWGEEWQGSTFGIHVAHNGVSATLRVGDAVDVIQRVKRPGAHGDGSYAPRGGCAVS